MQVALEDAQHNEDNVEKDDIKYHLMVISCRFMYSTLLVYLLPYELKGTDPCHQQFTHICCYSSSKLYTGNYLATVATLLETVATIKAS